MYEIFTESGIEKDTKVILTELYSKVEKALSNSKIKNAYKKYVNDFFSKRSQDVYDTLPCSRILCSEQEMDLLFGILGIEKTDVLELISETYYGKFALKHGSFNPAAALHPFTVTQLCVIRYFIFSNSKNERDTSILLLAFSGKFYPSLHYRSYPEVVPARHVMEYVINNELSQKYDLASKGSVMSAIQSVSNTWMETYKSSKFKRFYDEDIVYLIQQLHSRIGSFMKNIATEYYKAYENKDIYMAYSSDSFEQDNFHLADNDSLKVQRITEAVMSFITTNGVDYKICKACLDDNITPTEAKAVIESIVGKKENIEKMKELISLMVATYFATNSNNKDVTDISFITFTVAPKPNAKQKEIIRQKEIIEDFLSSSGTAYLRRRSRIATKNSYERSVRMYFALMIHNTMRKK